MKIRLFSWLFLIPLFQILLGIDILLVSGQCLDNQKSLLLQLKNGLTFESSFSTKLVWWNQSTDCCNWRGVTCNKSTGQVIGLDLNSESISGSSTTVFSLQFLQRLNLAYNSFNSTEIPSGLFNLTGLTYLNLSNSGFAGQIPNGFSRMTRLVTLDLSTLYLLGNSSLKLENPNLTMFFQNLTELTELYLDGVNSSLKLENPNLTMFFQNLTELTELYLDGVNISAHIYDWCQAISSSLHNLQVLSLSNCYISGPIDSSLAKLQFLSVIRLSQNNLNAPVPEFFANFKNLTALHLSSCNLSGTFPQRILKVPTLKTLDLSNNKLLKGSLPEFPENGSLRTLVLSLTKFSGPLPDSIGDLGLLSRMELSSCNFSGKIPNSMANCTQLVYLDFSINNFSGPIPSFQKSKNFTYLDLSHNKLHGAVPSTHFEGLDNLVNVDLQSNDFRGAIPSTLFALPSLRKIQLSHNHFDGLPANFSNAFSTKLNTLDLSSNNMNGSIPMSLFDLKSLNFLSLSSNKFTGKIQLEDLKKLGNLTSLDLSYNNLSVESRRNNSSSSPFPQLSTLKLASCKLQSFPNLRNQSKLNYLDLSDNQIGGEIPNWVWNIGNGVLTYLNLSSNRLVNLQEPYAISNLAVLDLHSNKLHGGVPIPPQTAIYVDYSANFFNSSIPTNVGYNLTYASFFSVSDNRLTGPIPESICNATYLQVLDLSNNSMVGMIPSCIFDLSKTLGVLNLGKNKFTGSISGTLPTNCVLETLDLHGNLLEGKVPESLASCTKLEVLNLGNNRMYDTFPCFLKNSSNLRVLVLRSNMFHGGTECREEINSWAELQIIDIASNNFSGSLSENFFNWKAMKDDKNNANHLSFEVLQFSTFPYQDAVTVTTKGVELELVKILTLFTTVDISNNSFEGDIPLKVGELKSLLSLNFSHNALTGSIPPSIGNLRQLESLDLSVNKLTGKIPEELVHLSFLAFLNLSYNQLTGQIPIGSQIQTFSETSFEGSKGLCVPRVNITCGEAQIVPAASTPTFEATDSDPALAFDWQFIFTGLGFGVGAGVVLGLVMLSKQGRHWWDKCIDELLIMILPTFRINHNAHDDVTVESEDDIEKESPEDSDEMEDGELGGRYCVFCSKIDVFRKTVVHNPSCKCHTSTPIYSSSSSFFFFFFIVITLFLAKVCIASNLERGLC